MFRLIVQPFKLNKFWNHQDARTRQMNRNVVYSMGIRVAGILVSLLLVPLTLDYLNPYEYGIWITLNSILTWINYFDIGLGNGLRNKLGEALASKNFVLGRTYVSTTLFLLTLIVTGLCVIILIANNFIDWNDILNTSEPIADLNQLVNVVLSCVCITFVLRIIGIVYMSYQRTWISSLLTFLGSFLSLLWIIYLKWQTQPSLFNVALAYSMSPIIVYILAYPVTFFVSFKEVRPSLRHIRLKYTKALIGLGMQFFILQMACLLIFATSNFLISNIFSPAEVTPYSIANKYLNVVAMLFMIIINPLWSAITDAYAKGDFQWIRININKMIRLWMLCSIGILFMVLVSPVVYKLWVGDILIPYSLSLSVGIYNIVLLCANLFSTYCNGVGHLRAALWSMSVAAIMFIPACLLLTKWMGVDGVAYSMALVLALPSVTLYFNYKKDMKCCKA